MGNHYINAEQARELFENSIDVEKELSTIFNNIKELAKSCHCSYRINNVLYYFCYNKTATNNNISKIIQTLHTAGYKIEPVKDLRGTGLIITW